MPNHYKKLSHMVSCLTVVAVVWGLVGCKVGPGFCKPNAEYLERAWSDQAHHRFNGQPVDVKTWWKAFNDPCLDGLVDSALADNLDLKQACGCQSASHKREHGQLCCGTGVFRDSHLIQFVHVQLFGGLGP